MTEQTDTLSDRANHARMASDVLFFTREADRSTTYGGCGGREHKI